MPLRRLLVPYDGSPFARRAFGWAVPLAQQHGSELRIVQAWGGSPAPSGDSRAETRGAMAAAGAFEGALSASAPTGESARDRNETVNVRRALRTGLERYAGSLRRRSGLTIQTAFLDGDPVDAVERAAREWRADLVVMATHGRSGVSRFWLGSVAEGLLRRLDVPMLLTRSARPAGVAAPDEPLFARVIVALDGSALAASALAAARDLVAGTGARLLLTQVIVAPAVPASPAWIAETAARVEREQLLPHVERLRREGVAAEARVVVRGQVAKGLLDVAAEERASLIALGTHGRTGAQRLLLGSVADKLVRASSGPLLVVPMT